MTCVSTGTSHPTSSPKPIQKIPFSHGQMVDLQCRLELGLLLPGIAGRKLEHTPHITDAVCHWLPLGRLGTRIFLHTVLYGARLRPWSPHSAGSLASVHCWGSCTLEHTCKLLIVSPGLLAMTHSGHPPKMFVSDERKACAQSLHCGAAQALRYTTAAASAEVLACFCKSCLEAHLETASSQRMDLPSLTE